MEILARCWAIIIWNEITICFLAGVHRRKHTPLRALQTSRHAAMHRARSSGCVASGAIVSPATGPSQASPLHETLTRAAHKPTSPGRSSLLDPSAHAQCWLTTASALGSGD